MNSIEFQRFEAKTKVSAAGCHMWIGARVPDGYGQMKVSGRVQYAHRLAYEHKHGSIPAGLVIDHLCRNRACVNPEHLEAVTARENIARGQGPTAIRSRAMKCIHGHELFGPNLYVKPNGNRVCKACKNARQNAANRRGNL